MFMFLLFLLFIPLNVICDEVTFEEYYQFGKNEYTSKNWPDCVAFMRRAVDDFRLFNDELMSCRRRCDEIVKSSRSLEKMSIYHENSEKALCLMRCRRDRLGETHKGIKKMNNYYDMMERKPYQYMHICYWKQGDLEMAVKAAYTFLISNQADSDIRESLKFYMNQAGYKDEYLVDLERSEYETKFMNAVEAYDEQDWSRCTHEFGSSLEKAMKEDEKCRLLCQDKIDWTVVDSNPEIDVLIASMRASVTRCEHNCLYKLGRVNGHYIGNLIASHFEYLHYCQFKLLRGTEAMQSVANYLLFDDNPLMRRNKYYYIKQYKKKELFVPDENIVKIYKKRELERRYLDFVERRFRLENNELLPEQADDHNPLDVEFDINDEFPYETIEHFLKPDECKLLRSLFKMDSIDSLISELDKRIKTIWPHAKYDSIKCDSTAREADCDRPIVLSTEKNDCSEWLGKWHTGCTIIFCDRK